MDTLLSLSEAALLLPHRPHAGSIWRWCRRGALARSGERIRLRHLRAGRRLLVREEDLMDFLRRLADADLKAIGDSPATRSFPTPEGGAGHRTVSRRTSPRRSRDGETLT